MKQFAAGTHVAQAVTLLSKLAVARRCLLTPSRKDPYDRMLRESERIEQGERERRQADDRPPLPGPTKLDRPRLPMPGPTKLDPPRSPTWIAAAVTGTGGVAAGLLLGLAIAAFSSPSPATSPDMTVAAAIAEDDGGRPPLKMTVQPADDVDAMGRITRRFGPGSPFARFAGSLQQAGAFNPEHYWKIDTPAGHFADAHLDLSVLGKGALSEGRINIEAVASLGPDDYFSVTLLFCPDIPSTNLALTAQHLYERVMLVGRALQLSAEESGRLGNFVGHICLSHPSRSGRAMATLIFIGEMPPRVQDRWGDALEYFSDKTKARADGVTLDSEWPAVGCELSDRWAVSLVFTATEHSMRGEVNYLQDGATWSLVFRLPRDVEFSSPDGSKQVGDTLYLPWPRLTIEEIDTL